MVALSQLGSWLGDQQILYSILISLAAVGLIWQVDDLLARYTTVSDRTIVDVRRFRPVATVTIAIAALSWIRSHPLPPWLATPAETLGAGQLLDGFVGFLPSFVVRNSGPLLATTLGAWWVWEMRATGDEIIERFVAAKYDETLAPIVENVWDVTIIAAFGLLVLDQWGISAATLLAPAGVIGIVVGFSARETVANFFGSIALYADDTYKRGDFIELESGISGTVRDISVRSTVLQTLDGDVVTIPNSQLNEGKIINKSLPRPRRRINSRIGVAYDSDPERVADVLQSAASQISQHREPTVHLRSFGDSALVFEVFVWIDKPADKRAAEDELNVAIYDALTAANIEIPFPQRDVSVDHPPQDRAKQE